jgi:hypothetical protein
MKEDEAPPNYSRQEKGGPAAEENIDPVRCVGRGSGADLADNMSSPREEAAAGWNKVVFTCICLLSYRFRLLALKTTVRLISKDTMDV